MSRTHTKKSKKKSHDASSNLKSKTWEEIKSSIEGTALWKKIFGAMKLLSTDRSMSFKERKKFYRNEIHPHKAEIDAAARKVENGTHEFMNSATTTTFGMQTALGINHMERTAKGKNGEELTIDNIIKSQRIKTQEYLCKPTQVKNLPKDKQDFFGGNKDQYVFHGHTNSGFYNTRKGKRSLVLNEGAGLSGFHKEQTEAQKISTHHLSLSRRLSKITDKHQARGKDILEAFNLGGFHKKSFWGNKNITSRGGALNLALEVEFNYKKRQTHEKKLREEYDVPDDISETYSEISTDSETFSEDFENFRERKKLQEPFRSFNIK